MVNCAVSGCKNYTCRKISSAVKFFQFPKDSKILSEWISACGQEKKINLKYSKICSDHFEDSDYCLKDQLLKTSFSKKRLNKTAVPTKYLSNSKFLEKTDRTVRSDTRNRKKVVQEIIKEFENAECILESES